MFKKKDYNLYRTTLIFVWITLNGMLCKGQLSIPPLSVGTHLESLTAPSAFSSHSNAVTSLRSNFPDETLKKIALSVEQFGVDLLLRISMVAEKDNRDFMISPFSIWSLLILLYEGAGGQTYTQLRQTLRIAVDDQTLRSAYRVWSSYLNTNTSTIEVASWQALYTDEKSPVTSTYKDTIQNYKVEPIPVNFFDRNTAAKINDATSRSTRGLIPYTVLPQEIFGAKIFMLSSLFFKGQWKFPFNESVTRLEPFYNEIGDAISLAPMMRQEANFAYVNNIKGLDGYVLELPYGTQNRLSMIIILPKKGIKLNEVAENLKTLGLEPILEKIAQFKKEAPEDNEVEVLMPKFSTTTDIDLTKLLGEMGIRDLFDKTRSDLSRMANDLYANLCVHSTKIIVDEQGTTAGASTAAVLINKTTPPRFQLNRPFLYMIVEKSTNLLLFTGHIRNPKAAAIH